MEIDEIYNVSISPLIVGRYAAQWAEDNHISILTERGIYIFELLPSPMSPHPIMRFSRSFIYSPSSLPGESLAKDDCAWLWNSTREKLYSLLMDESLTPNIKDITDMNPKIVNVAWSPQNLKHPNKCLLAVLTSAGAIVVLHQIDNDWYSAYDLTSMRVDAKAEDACLDENVKKAVVITDILCLKNRIRELQASAMVWSGLFECFSYIIVAYLNGDIVIYKIQKILDTKVIPLPQIATKTNLQCNSNVTTLHWITINASEHLIMVGYLDGRIHGFKIVDNHGDLKIPPVERYHDFSDWMLVSQLLTLSQNNCGTQILACKGAFLFLLRFTIAGIFKDFQCVQVKGFSISGICRLGEGRALVSTENGLLWSIDAHGDGLTLFEVKHSLPRAHIRYLGLTHSANHAFFVMVTSPSSMYDHLVLKEPSRMQFFGLTSEEWNPLSILKKKKGERLERLWDCLESIRIQVAKGQELMKSFPNAPCKLESLSLHELQITMWISVIMDVCSKRRIIRDFGSIIGEISDAQPLIFVSTACNYLEKLARKPTLSEEQRTSIDSLRMYLEIYLAGEESDDSSFICERAREIYEKTSGLSSRKIDSCILCGKLLDGLPWKTSACPVGHILPRCAITLLQVTNLHYRFCPICGQIFHPCLDKEYEEARCLFCDVPIICDSRVSVPKTLREKSFSRRRVGFLENPGVESEIDTMQ